jgi:hypothetical protein
LIQRTPVEDWARKRCREVGVKTRCWQRVKVGPGVLVRGAVVHLLAVGSYQWPEPEVGIWVDDADSSDGDEVESGGVLEQREVGNEWSLSGSKSLLAGVEHGGDLGGDGRSAMLEVRETSPRLVEVIGLSLR